MTTPKFTPGPWVPTGGCAPHFQHLVYVENTGKNIALCYSDETGANAALIAAAPEMWGLLSRLITTLEMVDAAEGPECTNFAIREAIGEAERLLNGLNA